MDFKKYHERHKAFKAFYWKLQVRAMLIGNGVGALWMIFVSFFAIKPEQFRNVRNVYYTTAAEGITCAVSFFGFLLILALTKNNQKKRLVWIDIASFLAALGTLICCQIFFAVSYVESVGDYLVDPLLGWLVGWSLYTMFCYFPLYLYLIMFFISSVSFVVILNAISFEGALINILVLALILLFGGNWRYNSARRNFEISEENRRLLESDRLTGVYNRRSYEERIAALREGKEAEATLVLFDVNGLKPANDTHGHLAGDELIIATANCISKVFDAYGKCFRIGGDEFVVVMEDNAKDINKLMKQFDETTAQWKGNYSDTLSVSYGIAQGKTEGDGISELIKTADANMYEAKRRYYVEHGIERRVTG